MTPDVYTAAVLVQSKVSIEPPQHRPSARSAPVRAALSTPSAPSCRECLASREDRVGLTIYTLTATNRSGIYTSILVMRQGRWSEATEILFCNEAVFCLQAKKPLHSGSYEHRVPKIKNQTFFCSRDGYLLFV